MNPSAVYARGNYAANNGIGPMVEHCEFDLPLTRMGGGFFAGSRTTLNSVVDGTSNTVFVAEVLAVPGIDFRGILHYGEGPLYHHNDTPNAPVPDQLRQRVCVSTPDAPCVGTYPGPVTTYSGPDVRRLVMAARSRHPGGVGAARGDGSVRFVRNSMSPATWRAVASPNGGEPPGGDW